MLAEANLEKKFWAEACNFAVHLLNRSPSKGAGMTPEQAWTGKIPNLSHIRVFGSEVMVHVPKADRKKWDNKATECILVGYDDCTKGYRVYDVEKGIVFKSRDVTFINEGMNKSKQVPVREESIPVMIEIEQDDEQLSPQEDTTIQTPINALPQQNLPIPPRQGAVMERPLRKRYLPRKLLDFEVDAPVLPSEISQGSSGSSANRNNQQRQSETVEEADEEMIEETEEEMPTHVAGLVAPPSYLNRQKVNLTLMSKPSGEGRVIQGNCVNMIKKELVTGVSSLQVTSDPETLKEAMNSPEAANWKLAMEVEYQSLVNNNTWTVTDLPEGREAIKTKWVFRTKRDVTGNVIQYKARLVAKGYSQRKEEDYNETYSPVVRNSALRYLFAYAANHGMIIHQMDAVSAFLQGEINEEIYIAQPQQFENRQGEGVCRLNKAIYGLKQSSRVWNQKLDKKLKQMGFKPTDYDPCVYYNRRGDKIFIIAVHVDDFILMTNDDD